MREYEVVFIIKATEADEAIESLVEQSKQVAVQNGAEMLAVETWGRRKLTYEIEKQREGYYVLLNFRSDGAAVTELERRLKLNEAVIRFLSVRVDDAMRRARRRASLRARKKGVEVPPELPRHTRPRDDVEVEGEEESGDESGNSGGEEG